MPRLDRRSFVLALGAIVAAPGAALAWTDELSGDFTLERVLVRSLADGKQIVVTRRWGITFARDIAGQITVDGSQSFSQVDAPPALQALAQIEEKRIESGWFPLTLGANGRIAAGPDTPPTPLPAEVVEEALAYAGARASGKDPQAATRKFLSDLSQQGESWLTLMPVDLFYPVVRDRRETRDIALPDGSTGTVTMRESAAARGTSGLLDTYLREATTTTSAMTRTGSERWTLTRTVS